MLSGPTSSIVARVRNGFGASARAGNRTANPNADINQTRLRGRSRLGTVSSMMLSREMLSAHTRFRLSITGFERMSRDRRGTRTCLPFERSPPER